jgi:hypothetical protein
MSKQFHMQIYEFKYKNDQKTRCFLMTGLLPKINKLASFLKKVKND